MNIYLALIQTLPGNLAYRMIKIGKLFCYHPHSRTIDIALIAPSRENRRRCQPPLR